MYTCLLFGIRKTQYYCQLLRMAKDQVVVIEGHVSAAYSRDDRMEDTEVTKICEVSYQQVDLSHEALLRDTNWQTCFTLPTKSCSIRAMTCYTITSHTCATETQLMRSDCSSALWLHNNLVHETMRAYCN